MSKCTERTSTRRAAAVAAVMAAAALGGCQTAGQGAASGAAIGALSGLAIGSLTGSAGTGAAIGAIGGAVGGAVIGDQNRRRNEAALASSQAATAAPASSQARYEAAPALERLVGRWDVRGWAEPEEGERINITGDATGIADKNFFVRLELRLTDPRSGETIEGTSVISQGGGRRITMVNSFSTSPDVMRFEGELDASGSIFTLRQVSPVDGGRRMVIRQSGTASWVAEIWEGRSGGERRSESLTFTAAR